MRVVLSDGVSEAAMAQSRRRLWIVVGTMLFAAPLALLQLRYVGSRGRGPWSWEFIAIGAGLFTAAMWVWWLVTLRSRRARLRRIIRASDANTWVAVIRARPNDLRPLARPVPPDDWATYGRWWNRVDSGRGVRPGVLTLRRRSLTLRFPSMWGSEPDLSVNLSEIEELRLSVDGDGRPASLALALNEHDLAYEIRDPVPASLPKGALWESDHQEGSAT